MCNKIHNENFPIPKTGKGYKLFIHYNDFVSLVDQESYKKSRDDFIEWKEELSLREGDGFCFFLSREEAERALSLWSHSANNVVAEIEYEEGICKQNENGFIDMETFEIALCKRFKIIKIVSRGDWIRMANPVCPLVD